MSASIVTDMQPGAPLSRLSTARRFQIFAVRSLGVALGLVLCITGWSHLQNEHFFYADIRQYGILGRTGTTLATHLLPWFHLAIGTCLLIDRLMRAATLLMCLLFGLYTAAQAWVWIDGKVIDCGCFGVLHTETIGPTTIARTLAFFVAAVVVAVATFRCSDRRQATTVATTSTERS